MVEHANDDELAEAAAHETETEEVAKTEVAEAEGVTEAADVDAEPENRAKRQKKAPEENKKLHLFDKT